YAAAAWSHAGRAGIYAASLGESFGAGLGTAAFLAFLMNVCDKQQAATQYALLSALFNLSGALGGVDGVRALLRADVHLRAAGVCDAAVGAGVDRGAAPGRVTGGS